MASLSEQLKDFRETPTGRVAIVAVPVVILALIIAFIAMSVLSGGSTDVETTAVETTASPANEPESSSEAAVDVSAAADSGDETTEMTTIPETTDTTGYINESLDIYETRDPFRPVDASETLTGLPITPFNGDPIGGGDQGGTTVTEVLTLESIEEDADGTLYANVTYGSSPYLVTVGDRVGSSPYQVSAVTADSATFLYGDDQVVLTVGGSVDK